MGTGMRPPRRKRRVVMAIGVIIICLMAAAFVGLRMGGGGANVRPQGVGLNGTLPGAHFRPEKPLDKLGVYEKMERDSARRTAPGHGDLFGRYSLGEATVDSSAGRLLGQLDQLKQMLRPPGMKEAPPVTDRIEALRPAVQESPGRERLAELLRGMHRPDTVRTDPELDRLSGMLDKIIRIQHGATDSGFPLVATPVAMKLEQPAVERAVKSMAMEDREDAGGFYGIDGEESGDAVAKANAFEAVIPESQVLVAGATVAMRLLQDARIGQVSVPRDELLYGKAALSGDRLMVTMSSMRVGGSVYPVALQVYDLDGLAGIHVPGAITREVLKQSAAGGVEGLGVMTAASSLGASAAEAGIAAGRSLLSRKISLVRVTVPAGYRVLLKNQKSENH